eukprot:292206_1
MQTQSQQTYGTLPSVTKPNTPKSSFKRYIIAFALLIACGVGFYYFYYNPTQITNVTPVMHDARSYVAVVTDERDQKFEEEQQQELETVTIKYTYEDLMEYADDMTP